MEWLTQGTGMELHGSTGPHQDEASFQNTAFLPLGSCFLTFNRPWCPPWLMNQGLTVWAPKNRIPLAPVPAYPSLCGECGPAWVPLLCASSSGGSSLSYCPFTVHSCTETSRILKEGTWRWSLKDIGLFLLLEETCTIFALWIFMLMEFASPSRHRKV